jgi:hypothetical protein
MPGRRLFAALVALFALPLPACIHVSAPAPPDPTLKSAPTARATDSPSPPRLQFAELPRVPGTVVQVRPAANPNSGANPTPPNTVTQKPNPPAGPAKPVEPPVRTANGAEPGTLPILQVTEAPLLAAVRAYVEGRPEKAIEIIRTLDKQNQDFVLAVLPILARGASADLTNDPATVAALVDQLHAAAARLEPRAALRIEKVAFCDDVKGFGRFVPHPGNSPYRPNAQAQLYLEVRNLGSPPAGDEFVTHVHATVEVRDAYGKLVEQIDPDDWRRRVPVVKFEKRLASHSPLHDFHVLYVFSAPPAPGVYTVTVELRDASGRRTVKTAPAQFCVAGP